MHELLNNPVYNALTTDDAQLGKVVGKVCYYDEQVSPFVGFPRDHLQGFDELYDLLPVKRRILYATPGKFDTPRGWEVKAAIDGVQFVFEDTQLQLTSREEVIALDKTHVNEMIALAQLTKPGPFDTRTIEFGYYHGIFAGEKLVAITGQRMHVPGYAEISAVCTHPDHLGRGYAAALIGHQVNLILSQGKTPFLHSRADNARAIAVYERLGFERSRPMNFYFMKKA